MRAPASAIGCVRHARKYVCKTGFFHCRDAATASRWQGLASALSKCPQLPKTSHGAHAGDACGCLLCKRCATAERTNQLRPCARTVRRVGLAHRRRRGDHGSGHAPWNRCACRNYREKLGVEPQQRCVARSVTLALWSPGWARHCIRSAGFWKRALLFRAELEIDFSGSGDTARGANQRSAGIRKAGIRQFFRQTCRRPMERCQSAPIAGIARGDRTRARGSL